MLICTRTSWSVNGSRSRYGNATRYGLVAQNFVQNLLRKMKTRDAVQEPNLWDGGNDVASIDIETKVI